MSSKKLVVRQDLEKMTVPLLKALMKGEGIDVPSRGTGVKGRVNKPDLIRAIIDAQSKKAKVKHMIIPAPPIYSEESLKGMGRRELRKICRDPSCKGKKKAELIQLILAAQNGIEIPAPTPRYQDQSLVQLRKLCRQRDIKAEKCRLNKKELIVVLSEWDRLQAKKEEEEALPPSPKVA